MAQIRTANIGSYPRVGEEKDRQRHRRALTHLQNKEISPHAFHDVEQSVIQEIVREQLITNIDEVTDGQVSWHDPISHLCRKLAGVRCLELSRFFDTNTYYRVPVFTGKPRKKGLRTSADFQFAQSISHKPVRAVLTGPYTLARLTKSEITPFKKFPARLAFFTELIRAEIKGLTQLGAQTIQIDEPAFATFPEDIVAFRRTIDTVSRSIRPAKLILAFYFSPLAKIYNQIRTLPVDGLNLDFTYDGKKLMEAMLQHPPSMSIGFGLINGRNTRMEAIDPILNMLKTWVEKIQPTHCTLTPSCGLEHLPQRQAFEKLKLISKIRDELVQSLQTK